MRLDYEQINLDGGTQPRVAIRLDVVREYADAMREGAIFPPIIVFFDGLEYWLADGFHRVAAAMRVRPSLPIDVEIIEGTQSDAQWYSFGVNQAHGLRRTNEDKERAVRAALKHEKSASLSNQSIADHCGVSEFTIRKYRDELESTSRISKSTDARRTNVTHHGGDERQLTSILSKSNDTRQPDGHALSTPQGNGGEPNLTSILSKSNDTGNSRVVRPPASRPRTGRDGRTINTARIGKPRRSPSPASAKPGTAPANTALSTMSARDSGDSEHLISVRLSPNEPAPAAATLMTAFPRAFIRALVDYLNAHLAMEQ
jgi:hypothetical protein